jgi:hypothetical protein
MASHNNQYIIMLTIKRINKAIEHTGLIVHGNGDGYFYFIAKATDYQMGCNVNVCRINHQSIEQWVRDAEEAAASNIIEGLDFSEVEMNPIPSLLVNP